jgi:pilus assembly protein TadC
MDKGSTSERTREWFEKKWGIEGMVPNQSRVRKSIIRKVILDSVFYVLLLAAVIGYGLYTGILLAIYPFIIAFFISLAFIIAVISLHAGFDPFAVVKRKIRMIKREMGKK